MSSASAPDPYLAALFGSGRGNLRLSDDAQWISTLAYRFLDDWLSEADRPAHWGQYAVLAAAHQAGYLGQLLGDVDDSAEETDEALGTHAGRWVVDAAQAAEAWGTDPDTLNQTTNAAITSMSRGGMRTVSVPHLVIASLVPFLDRPGFPAVAPAPHGLLDAENIYKDALSALGKPNKPATVRPARLEPELAARTVSAFEAPFAALSQLAHDPSLPEWDAEFVRNTLEQISLWRRRDDANPQILELLVADVVKRLHERLTDTSVIESSLLELGADADVAADVAARTSAAIREVALLGADDPAADGERIDVLADEAEDLASEVAAGIGSATGQGTDRSERYRHAIVEGVANGAAASALTALAAFTGDHVSQVQLGLVAAWTWVRSFWS